MINKLYRIILRAEALTIFLILFSMTAFAGQTYYYSYTIMPEEPPYIEQEYKREPITVSPNPDGSCTVKDKYSTVILAKQEDGSFFGMTQYISYSLSNDELVLGYDDPSADVFSLSPDTEGWIKFNDKWYYLGEDGKAITNQWVENFYLGDDGVMLTNAWTPDGMYVGDDGLCIGHYQH